MGAAAIRTAFVQEDHHAAVAQWRQIVGSLGKRFPKLAAMTSDAEQDVLAFMAFPQESLEADTLDQPPGTGQQGD